MSSPEISEDEDTSVESMEVDTKPAPAVIQISSDEDTENYFTSDDSCGPDLPKVELNNTDLKSKRTAVIKNLFPKTTKKFTSSESPNNNKFTSLDDFKYKKTGYTAVQQPPKPYQQPSTSRKVNNANAPLSVKTNPPGIEKMIGGVKVNIPVQPYGSQIALMFKLITAINKRQNCLLESPTGSGKTLALLCSALAWQLNERDRLKQLQNQQYFSNQPGADTAKGVAEYNASPLKKPFSSPSKSQFGPVFGKGGPRSIYDDPPDCTDDACCSKRNEPLLSEDESPAQVTVHKRRRLNDSELSPATSPEKMDLTEPVDRAEQMPKQESLPIIYYGARTHKQLQQVIKEFSRTWYCGQVKMTVLSSREHSCIREFDRKLWGTKNDMCRGCTKHTSTDKTPKKGETNCLFYNNREALHHSSLPGAFDLEDLVAAGEELSACPYYAARAMATASEIVFCPYNYLIEPGIRSSMQINLENNILIIDEAHNIEDICRDAATTNIARDDILAALKELQVVAEYRFSNQEVSSYVDKLIRALRCWDDWFGNQSPLVANKSATDGEAAHPWQVDHFLQTLDNHNIGERQYKEFSECAGAFVRRLREDPRALVGATQHSATLLENLDAMLGYLYRESGKYKEDFKPVLIRAVPWRSSFSNSTAPETLSLRLLCLSSAVVFSTLKAARLVALSSGTLTPLHSLHSELGTEFPLQVSPNHVISKDRVWIGTLTSCPRGLPLQCRASDTRQPRAQDAVGAAVLLCVRVTPHGVLCFLPSYPLMDMLRERWQETGLWAELNKEKHVFMESRNTRDHNDIMEDYYKYVGTQKGALLFAVYRGKVSEGMDFKDHQARTVITVGVPYPNTFNMAVKEKMAYNDKYHASRGLLPSREWLRVQAYRALNQAVGRCVRHKGDWGAVLLLDARFAEPYYTEHLSKWAKEMLGNNHHTFDSLENSANSLQTFMQAMAIREKDEDP